MNHYKILLRFDDICPTMNWEQWEKAKSILDITGAKALLGVIPDNQDPDLMIDKPKPDFWEYITHLQQEGFVIAMHGYQHRFDINSPGIITRRSKFGNHSEFAGHSYEVQYRKIKEGKDILLRHGIETNIFFSPAHAYDDNTLKALAALGFQYISDGRSHKAYERQGIICLPALSTGIPNIKRGIYHTAIIHAHEWIRVDKKYALDQFVNLCKVYKNEIVSFDEYKKQPRGNSFIQKLDERLTVFWQRNLKPFLKKIM